MAKITVKSAMFKTAILTSGWFLLDFVVGLYHTTTLYKSVI